MTAKWMRAGFLAMLVSTPALLAQEESYSPSQLRREQVEFKGYLVESETDLTAAKRRADDNCELATASTLASYAEKDLSKMLQYGYLERVKETRGAGLKSALMESREITDAYNADVVPQTQSTEEDIEKFVNNSLSKLCPGAIALINRYKTMAANLNPTNQVSRDILRGISQGTKSGMSAEAVVKKAEETSNANGGGGNNGPSGSGGGNGGNSSSGGGSGGNNGSGGSGGNNGSGGGGGNGTGGGGGSSINSLPNNPSAADLDNLDWSQSGLSPDDIAKVKHALSVGDYDGARKILAQCDTPFCKELKRWIDSHGSDKAGVEKATRPWSAWDNNGQRHCAEATYPQGMLSRE